MSDLANSALITTSKLSIDSATKGQVNQSLSVVIDEIEGAVKREPEKAIDALANIGEAAQTNNNSYVYQRVVQRLKNLSADPTAIINKKANLALMQIQSQDQGSKFAYTVLTDESAMDEY